MSLKTDREIEILARAGTELHAILMRIMDRVVLGATGRELDSYAEEQISACGGVPAFKGYGNPSYPATICVSVNDGVVHGIPDDRPFQDGDIVSVDIGMIYEGLYTDMARTISIGTITDREHELIRVADEALAQALKLVRPGRTTGDIGFLVQSYVERHGFGVVRDLAGHGVGHALHEDPEVPNFGEKGAGEVLEAGMVLALEPMITLGGYAVRIASDGWSVKTRDGSKAAHSEDMVAVTKRGNRILTRPS